MELKDQVCTLEQAKRLKELGVSAHSIWWWKQDRTPTNSNMTYYGVAQEYMPWDIFLGQRSKISGSDVCFEYPAYTASELGEMLPCESGIIGWEVYYNDHIGEWNCVIRDLVKWKGGNIPPPIAYESEGDTMVEAMADALIHCLENKLVTP